MNNFVVRTEQFEGPLDLLLSLIEKRKLFINDIALAKVTDDYISHIESHPHVRLGENAHFILVASTLLLIKSKSLLPTLELDAEEQQSIEDLEQRLKEYQRIKELSRHIQERFGKKIMYLKEPAARVPVFAPHATITASSLLGAVKSVLQALPKPEKLPQVIVKKVISLEDMIGRLTDRITSSLKMSFKDFSGHKGPVTREEKVTVIVSFLAMLELVKKGMIDVRQHTDFDDIEMETENVGVPRYI